MIDPCPSIYLKLSNSQSLPSLTKAPWECGGGVGGLSKNKKWHNPMTQWWLSGRVEHSKEATIKGCLASLDAFKFQRPGFVTRCHFSSPEQLSKWFVPWSLTSGIFSEQQSEIYIVGSLNQIYVSIICMTNVSSIGWVRHFHGSISDIWIYFW